MSQQLEILEVTYSYVLCRSEFKHDKADHHHFALDASLTLTQTRIDSNPDPDTKVLIWEFEMSLSGNS